MTGQQQYRYAPRVAGFAFLFLIVTVLASGLLSGGVSTLTDVAENAARLRVSLVLTAVAGITTLVLAAMLYAMVADEDRNLAILALSCRAVEAGLYAVSLLITLALLSLSQSEGGANDGLADLLLHVRSMGTNVGAIFFAAGSTVYCYLLLRARSIPVPLAALGLVGSLIALVGVPVQTALSQRTFAGAWAIVWVPVGVFEIATGFWLLLKGAAATSTAEPSPARNPAIAGFFQSRRLPPG